MSNPQRILILGKEFIISRNDLLKDLRKTSIIKNEDKNLCQQLVETILG
jgi:hypothetical protein